MAIRKPRERIGIDFDGTLTKFPPGIRHATSFIGSSKSNPIFYKIWGQMIIHLPILLHHRRLRKLIKHKMEFDFFLISGRRGSTRLLEQKLLDFDYDRYFCEIITQNRSSKLSTSEWKVKVCKALGIDYFFDDNRYTVSFLRKHGIKAMKV